jgi:hypothetical protein
LKKIIELLWADKSDSYARRLWLLFFAVVALLAFFQPAHRNITHHYSRAAFHWWKSQDMYSLTGNGYLYFPQAVLVYAPFAWQEFPENLGTFKKTPLSETLIPYLPLRIAEVLYRAFALGVFAWAIWRMCKIFKPDAKTASLFALVTVLTLPASLTAGRNGQFNMLLSAAIILAAVEASNRHWWKCVFWLIAGIILKPLGIVPMMLFVALFKPLWWRLPVGLAAFVALSFVHYNPEYVLRQWQMCIEQMQVASQPLENLFDDISAMFATFGIHLADATWFYIRAGFAPITLILSWRMVRLYGDKLAPFLVAALASAYLMIFNPRTETVSFLVLSPYIALLAAIIFRQKAPMALGWLLVFLCVGLGSDCYGDIYKLTRIWFKPMLSCIFFFVLVALAFKKAGFLDWEKKAADPQ